MAVFSGRARSGARGRSAWPAHRRETNVSVDPVRRLLDRGEHREITPPNSAEPTTSPASACASRQRARGANPALHRKLRSRLQHCLTVLGSNGITQLHPTKTRSQMSVTTHIQAGQSSSTPAFRDNHRRVVSAHWQVSRYLPVGSSAGLAEGEFRWSRAPERSEGAAVEVSSSGSSRATPAAGAPRERVDSPPKAARAGRGIGRSTRARRPPTAAPVGIRAGSCSRISAGRRCQFRRPVPVIASFMSVGRMGMLGVNRWSRSDRGLDAHRALLGLGDLLDRSRARARSRGLRSVTAAGGNARSKTCGRSSLAIPGPWSRTRTAPPSTVTSTGWSSGPHLSALSIRVEIARASAGGEPWTVLGARVVENFRPMRRAARLTRLGRRRGRA